MIFSTLSAEKNNTTRGGGLPPKDRRSFNRISTQMDVYYKVFYLQKDPPDGETISSGIGKGVNLSANGLLLETEMPIVSEAIISLLFNLPGLNRRIRTLAEVVRTSHVNGPQAGLRFLRMCLNDAIALMQYVSDCHRNLQNESWSSLEGVC